MIQIDKASNVQSIYCTPREKLTSAPAFYYFKFTSRQTKQVVQFTAVDISTTQRFQKFVIDAAVKFANQKEGFWTYQIKAATINNNLDPGGVVLEEGLAYIRTAATPFNGIYNDQSNQVKNYSK